jgi:hypothetical protein
MNIEALHIMIQDIVDKLAKDLSNKQQIDGGVQKLAILAQHG